MLPSGKKEPLNVKAWLSSDDECTIWYANVHNKLSTYKKKCKNGS